MDELLQPFGWWFSGRYWYCHLQRPADKAPVSGCGTTKPQAVKDARLELREREGKRAHSAGASDGK